MKNILKSICIGLVLVPAMAGAAQEPGQEKYAVKLGADIGLGSALSVKSNLQDVSTKSSGYDIGVGFGWTFWRQNQHSLEANIGLGYGLTSLTSTLAELSYHYNAPADADMDGVPYIRYYDVKNLKQKSSSGRLAIPLYVNYGYDINKVVTLRGLLGFRFGFNFSPKIKESSGETFSYGVYPVYDDLMIDASYMNEFGAGTLSSADTKAPKLNGVTAGFMVGAGAEFRVYGPLSVDLSIRYDVGFNNLYKGEVNAPINFDSQNAPVTYTVADGETVAPFTNYFKSSKPSRLSLSIGVGYHF